MSYPSGVITRQVSFGGASTVESGEPLKIQVTTESSRSLIWRGTGYRLESLKHTITTETPGEEIFFEVPVTDQNGWNDAETRQAIIVNPGESSHTYTTTLRVYNGQELVRAYVIGPYPVANEPGVLDGDLISSEVDPVDGTLTVYVPGPSGDVTPEAQALLGEAEDAANRAEQARDQAETFAANTVELQDAAIAQAISAPGSETQTQLNATIVQAVADNVPPLPPGIITSASVSRMVAVPEGEPLPPLLDGDLVFRYVVPGAVYYKDFSGDTIDAEPTGMTKLLTGTATVKANAGATGGQALEVAGITTSGTGYAITETMDDEYLDSVEMLVRWSPMDSTSSGIAFWVNVDTVADSAYRGSYNLASGYGQARITPRINGVNESYVEVPVSVPDAFDAGSWVLTRMRIEEGVLNLKHWQDGEVEPDWRATMNDSRVPTNIPAPVGKVGTAAGFHIDYVVVATGGRLAVKP